jgi:RimJ/RimL family protein N-acetyltransferase
MTNSAAAEVSLRDVRPEDLPVFFGHESDRTAIWMAAFTADDPDDRKAFGLHWAKVLADPSNRTRTVLVGRRVAGHIAAFEQFGKRSVSYWIGREFWGRGVATRALDIFLDEERTRPLFARVAFDNLASRRVLEKCGFALVGREKGFAAARGAEIEELIFELDPR